MFLRVEQRPERGAFPDEVYISLQLRLEFGADVDGAGRSALGLGGA